MIRRTMLKAPAAWLIAGFNVSSADEPADPRRMVLVELYTSQGCDMCPEAERILGTLAERDPRIVPIAFHVDYFNDPWKDVFSDPLYTQRQVAYNEIYPKPRSKQRNVEYSICFTPMLMIDGERVVNGRDSAGAEAAIRRATAKKPAVGLDVALDVQPDGLSASATITVSSRTPRAENTPLLVCAVVREDRVTTRVASGENAGKSLLARYPARLTKYDYIGLDDESSATRKFAIDVNPSWKRENLRLAVFVQDKKTGLVHQSADLPWRSTAAASDSASRNRRRPILP